MTRGRLLLVLLLAGAAGAAWWIWGQGADDPVRPSATYVDPVSCYTCHDEQHRRWGGSHHQLAMQLADSTTVLADVEDTEHTHHGVTTRFSREEGGPLHVEAQDADGEMQTFPVAYVFGVEPLQQYLVEFPDGRVQCLLTAWDTQKNRWFHLYDEPVPAGDELHWTGLLQNWNFMCAECHSTNLERNYDVETDTYTTTWSEINVGCQACHGPGSEHERWAKANTGKPGTADLSATAMGLVVDMKAADPAVQVENCARCHSRRSLVSPRYRHGDRFLDHYALQLLNQPYYHLDGQILDEVYVYGSFLQSKKHAAGVRCTDCHDPHTTRLKHEGDALCLQCHQAEPPERFPTLKKQAYDTPAHHFHSRDTPGAACVECHMADRVYMQVDPRRDHSFRVPRPDLSVRLGTPNACNGCHEDKDAFWAAAEVESWFPDSERRRKMHFAEALAVADTGDRRGPNLLAAVIADEDRPGIVRATAVVRMGAFRGPIPQQILEACLVDKEPLVRAAALGALVEWIPRSVAPGMKVYFAEHFGPLLSDDIRLVRTEAARAMVTAVGTDVPPEFAAAFAIARAEYVARQEAHRDRPDGAFNLALLHEAEGNTDAALAMYAESLERSPDFVPALMNRATLRNSLGDNALAAADLEQVTTRYPEAGEAWYSLGLLRAEMNAYPEAVEALTHAARLLPERGRVHKNLGLALRKIGDDAAAEASFVEAARWIPNDPDLTNAVLMLYLDQENWFEVERWAKRLYTVVPGNAEARRLWELAREKQGG